MLSSSNNKSTASVSPLWFNKNGTNFNASSCSSALSPSLSPSSSLTSFTSVSSSSESLAWFAAYASPISLAKCLTYSWPHTPGSSPSTPEDLSPRCPRRRKARVSRLPESE